eukprot:6207302-Pleurochrysis_carterae.AAC.1
MHRYAWTFKRSSKQGGDQVVRCRTTEQRTQFRIRVRGDVIACVQACTRARVHKESQAACTAQGVRSTFAKTSVDHCRWRKHFAAFDRQPCCRNHAGRLFDTMRPTTQCAALRFSVLPLSLSLSPPPSLTLPPSLLLSLFFFPFPHPSLPPSLHHLLPLCPFSICPCVCHPNPLLPSPWLAQPKPRRDLLMNPTRHRPTWSSSHFRPQ